MQVLSIVKVKINGTLYRTDGACELMIGKPKREPVVGDAFHGYKEEPATSKLSGNFIYNSELDLEELGDIVGATIECETDIGDVWVMPDAVSNGEAIKFKGKSSGEVAVEFFGGPAFKQ